MLVGTVKTLKPKGSDPEVDESLITARVCALSSSVLSDSL